MIGIDEVLLAEMTHEDTVEIITDPDGDLIDLLMDDEDDELFEESKKEDIFNSDIIKEGCI